MITDEESGAIQKFHIVNMEEREARKWGSRFCSIKAIYAPELDCEIPATPCGFIDATRKLIRRGLVDTANVEHMLKDAKRRCPTLFSQISKLFYR